MKHVANHNTLNYCTEPMGLVRHKIIPGSFCLYYTDLHNHLATIRREMRQEVDSFHRRLSEIVEELKKRHMKERRRFLARRRRSFVQITLSSFRNFSENWKSRPKVWCDAQCSAVLAYFTGFLVTRLSRKEDSARSSKKVSEGGLSAKRDNNNWT